MFCPNCGTENLSESRFCVKCAHVLQAAVATRSIDESPTSFEEWAAGFAEEVFVGQGPDPIEFGLADEAEAVVWPPETVFVPGTDIAEGEAVATESRGTVQPAFEDDSADDDFELSLSGLRLDDLAETEPELDLAPEVPQPTYPEPESTAAPATGEPEPALDPPPEVPHPTHPEPESAAAPASAKPGPSTNATEVPGALVADPTVVEAQLNLAEVVHDEVPPPIRVVDAEPASAVEVAGIQKPRRGVILRTVMSVAGLFIVVLAIYAAGVVSAVLYVGLLSTDVPRSAELPLVEENPEPQATAPGMAYIPGGEFLMGSNEGDVFARPAHFVKVEPFFIDLTEVTNEAYAKFVNATGHDPPPAWKGGTFPDGQGRYPVTGVSWFDAAEYAAWMGKRLPTEAEWEFAARGTDGRIYPWGNEWAPLNANAGSEADGVRNVGEGGRSPFGLFDMSGNAWEWTSSDARPFPGGKKIPWSRLRLKIIRGGNWQSKSETATAVFRGFYGAFGEREYDGTSFRCVKDLAKN